jgi:acetyl esterase
MARTETFIEDIAPMPIDPKIQEILDFIASRNVPPFHELSPEEARLRVEKSREIFGGDPVDLPRVEDLTMPGPAGEIALRLYASSSGGSLPVLVYFHGGGWVVGSLDSYDALCRGLARESGCLVISVDYRLAPEHKFPAGLDDAWAALEWIAAHAPSLGGDSARLAVGGDSAGGNLAAVVSQMAREFGGPPIAHQLLIYPATTHDLGTESMQAHAEDGLLTLKDTQWFWAHYLTRPEEAASPRVCPLKAESLAGLPPAHVVIAEIDVLADEGRAYAKALEAAGVPVRVTECPGMIHGFMSMTILERTQGYIAEMGAVLKEALG